MARHIRDPLEFREEVKDGIWLILFVRDGRSKSCKYAISLIEDLKSYMSRINVKVGVIYADLMPKIVREEGITSFPHFKLYVNGSPIWEQIGCLMNYENDIKVLKRSIRLALTPQK